MNSLNTNLEVAVSAPLDLTFPKAALKGSLGDLSELLSRNSEVSPEMVFGAALTCLGSMITGKLKSTKADSDVRLFTILLGPSYNAKKSTAIHKTRAFFEQDVKSGHPLEVCEGVGSAEGLAKKLEKTPSLLLTLDELESFFKKASIEGSVLLQTVNSLFEKTSYETVTRNAEISIPSARLSFLAACTLATYEHCWSADALSIGFDNRLFLVNGSLREGIAWDREAPPEERHEIALRIQAQLARLGDAKHPLVIDGTLEAYRRYTEWYQEEIHASSSPYVKRLDTIASRLLPLLAFTQDKPQIDIDVVDSVIEIMRHQLNLRRCYNPIDAENKFARMEASIRRKLQEKGPLPDRELQKFTNATRVGTWVYKSSVTGLLAAGIIKKGKNGCLTLTASD